MLSWLSVAMQSLPPETTYVLKPHPACPITLPDFPSGTLTISHAPLTELFLGCDVVFTSNTTSAAVDAYCSGLPVVQMLAGNTLNLSPLRGLKGASYVTAPQELASALLHVRHDDCIATEPFFYLDQELPRWVKLLNLDSLESPVR
jgi:surface carbohydrate biosynthesis protein (TIGR04326 family)